MAYKSFLMKTFKIPRVGIFQELPPDAKLTVSKYWCSAGDPVVLKPKTNRQPGFIDEVKCSRPMLQ